jgi:hypothetical protein
MSSSPRRIERKYCVSEGQAAAALRVAALFLGRDRGISAPQTITSLYLDSPALTFFSWQQARRRRRFKLRLRAYGSAPPAVVYAEIKNKTDRWVHKQRAAIPLERVPSLWGTRWPEDELQASKTAADGEDLGAFRQRLWTFAARPQLLLRCERESFRGKWEEAAVAVTVDRAIAFQTARSASLGGVANRWKCLSLPDWTRGAHVILEIKHGASEPCWMEGLTRTLAPRRVSFSKYATAMRQMLSPNPSGYWKGAREARRRQDGEPRRVERYALKGAMS